MRVPCLAAWFLASISACPRLASASPPPPLSLREALTTAVRASPQLAGTRIDLLVAEARVTSAEGATDWILTGGAKLDGVKPNPGAGPGSQLVSSATLAVSAGLTRPLPGGGSVGVVATGQATRERTTLRGAEAATVSARTSTTTTDLLLVLRQPLLRGWRGDAAPRTQLARTRASRDVAELEATTTAASVVRDIVRAYWEVGAARDQLAILRSSLGLAEEQLRVTRARMASGKVSESEALAVGQAISVRQDELAQAEVTFVRRSTELRRLIGGELTATGFEIEPADPAGLAASDPDLDRELAFAMERNPELATLRARGAAAAIEVDVTANGLLPSLDLSLSAGPRARGASVREATDGTMTFDGGVASIELTFSMPLGNRAASGAHAVAARQLRRVRYDEAELRAQVASAVIEATVSMRTARTRARALADAVRLGDEAIAAELERWQQGKSTNYDVMKRQAERADSALRRARALVDYLEAEAALDALTGAILPRYGIAIR